MGREFGDEFSSSSSSDPKTQLVKQICNISTGAIFCAQSHPHANANKLPFIDWYLILQVEENARIDTIRKKYHKLGTFTKSLQLHPDKNNHSMAETAFKLLSEAYACLSDDARRVVFDVDRVNSFCFECSRDTSGKPKVVAFGGERLRNIKILKRIRDVRVRFMEEARVIEECLKANSTPRKEYPCFGSSSSSAARREIPVFSPSNCSSKSQYYQWARRNCEMPDGFLSLRRRENAGNCDSPIFECRPEKRKFKFGL